MNTFCEVRGQYITLHISCFLILLPSISVYPFVCLIPVIWISAWDTKSRGQKVPGPLLLVLPENFLAIEEKKYIWFSGNFPHLFKNTFFSGNFPGSQGAVADENCEPGASTSGLPTI